MRDSATGEIRGMAPIFDNNMSLFAGAMPNELKAGAMLERAKSGRGAFDPLLDDQAALVIGPVQKEQLVRFEGFAFERHQVLQTYIGRRAEQLLSLPTVDPDRMVDELFGV